MSKDINHPELKSLLEMTTVGEITISTRPTLSSADTVAKAAAEMRKESHGSALVCDDGKIVGIITERDLIKFISDGYDFELPLTEVMTKKPVTVTTHDTLFFATESMHKGGYRRLPVIDENEKPVGIIDVKTISHFLVEHFATAVYNQAAHDKMIAKNREGA